MFEINIIIIILGLMISFIFALIKVDFEDRKAHKKYEKMFKDKLEGMDIVKIEKKENDFKIELKTKKNQGAKEDLLRITLDEKSMFFLLKKALLSDNMVLTKLKEKG